MKKIINYLPDTLIIIGIVVLSYNSLRLPKTIDNLIERRYSDYHTGYKVVGIMLIVIGIDILIRRYFFNRSKSPNA